MSKTLEGMARTFFEELDRVTSEEAMRAALLWLADNVSDEMVKAATIIWKNDQSSESFEELLKFVISAALRAAARENTLSTTGDEMLKGDTKEVKTVVVQPEPPIEKRVLADAIVAVSKAMTDLQKSGLNREAIVVLVCTETKLSRRDVNAVLDALRILKARYTTLCPTNHTGGEVMDTSEKLAWALLSAEDCLNRAIRAEAEVERLKLALWDIATNADAASDLPLFRVQCRDFARSALEEKP